jgi:PKD repeat protein
MRRLILIIPLVFGMLLTLSAQNHFECSTPEMNRIELENNPEAQKRRAQLKEFIRNYSESKADKGQVYVIPVVFHIVHNYGEENIPYEQVEDVIRVMNEDYRKMNPDTTYIIDEFKSLAADTRIEFRLAKKDPWGNCTNGVTRTVSYATNGAGENVKDIAPGWPMASYLNVWVVRSIGSGAAGYSYYPGTVGDGRDGIVVTHSYVGSIGTGSVGRSRTLTHEAGHWLNLAHPWGSSNEPGLSSNCDMDDGIEDTPNTIGHTTCALNAVTCGSLDNVQNYMDYSYCTRMFSHGQGEMMRAILNSSVNDRNNLWTEANLIATGTLNPDEAEICAANADFSYDVSRGCEGLTVQFTDLTYGSDSISQYEWTFPGGNPETSTERHPTVVYETAGEYAVELNVTNPAGNDTKTVAQAININRASDGAAIPFYDDLESAGFPGNHEDASDYYAVVGGNTGWLRTDNASNSGDKSMFIDLSNEERGMFNAFVTPAIQVDSLSFPLEAGFKLAYSQQQETNTDVLMVSVSKNCGESWFLQYYKSGNQLHTAYNLQPWGTFYPTQGEWRGESFELSESIFRDASSIRLKFEALSREGNAMYIDDIEIRTPTGKDDNIQRESVSLYPTSFENSLYLETSLRGKALLSLHNVTGQKLMEQQINLNGKQNIAGLLPENLQGLYILTIGHADHKSVIRIHAR